MRAGPAVLLMVAVLAGCGYNDESRPLVRAVGLGATAGALGGTLFVGPPAGTAVGAIAGASAGAITGYAIERLSGTPALATLPPQFDGTVAVAPPAPPPSPAADTGYKPFGNY